MRLNQTYENALILWVHTALPDYVVIWDKQNVETPSEKYVAVNILTSGLSEPVNSPNITSPSTDNFLYELAETMSVQFQLFSDDGYLQDMGKLRRSFYHESTRKILSDAGLTRQKLESVVDLTGLANTGFKFACSFDCFLGYKAVDSVQADGEIDRVSGEVLGIEFDVTK